MTDSATLEQRGSVFILDLGDTENRFNFDSIAHILSLLDQVDAADGDRVLVTVATGKFWSNGLDLDWMLAHRIELADLVVAVQELFARVMEAAYPTVAVIQGHCYAAGAMLALAHDARFMREDRGFMCFPEVNIGLTFSAGMQALLLSKLTPQTAHQSMVLGRRFTPPEAAAAGMIDATFVEDQLLDRSLEYATSLLGRDAVVMQTIKKELHRDTLALLRTAP